MDAIVQAIFSTQGSTSFLAFGGAAAGCWGWARQRRLAMPFSEVQRVAIAGSGFLADAYDLYVIGQVDGLETSLVAPSASLNDIVV